MTGQERNINLNSQDFLISLQLTQVTAHHGHPGHEWAAIQMFDISSYKVTSLEDYQNVTNITTFHTEWFN